MARNNLTIFCLLLASLCLTALAVDKTAVFNCMGDCYSHLPADEVNPPKCYTQCQHNHMIASEIQVCLQQCYEKMKGCVMECQYLMTADR